MGKSVKMFLEDIWKSKDCLGWAWHLKGRQYNYQTANDLGLLGEDWDAYRETGHKEVVLRKIYLTPGKCIYIIKNSYGHSDVDFYTSATLPTIKALMKEAAGILMTDHEKYMCDRYWAWH